MSQYELPIPDGPTLAAVILSAKNNILHNPAFQINQHSVTGTVTLTAGQYGHDRWKAGSSGCTYTFATSGGVTTLTIIAGSLCQVVEGADLESGTYCLSWEGTAQGKIGAGSFAASGVTGTVTGGTNLTIEYGTGTLAKPKLEEGSIPTLFRKPGVAEELQKCQRYYQRIPTLYAYGYCATTTNAYVAVPTPVPMRISPTAIVESVGVLNVSTGTAVVPSSIAVAACNNNQVHLGATCSGLTVGALICLHDSIIALSADL